MATGAFLVLIGHYFRIGAMWTAGSNFNHEIMYRVRCEIVVFYCLVDRVL